YTEWSPESDPYIAANYSAGNLGGKLACKRDVQKEMGLPQRDDVPLIGMVGRMVKQKGIDVFAEALPRLLELELQIVMLGEGEPWAHFYFGGMASSHRNKLSVCVGYDNGLSHRIEAGADFFLMPSAFEPCGLNQMYSLRYGTIPIVRAVGGLEDSVDNFDEVLLTGTGFKFRDLTAGALFDTVGWALHTWYNRRDAIDKLRQSAMSARFTWESAAEKYDHLYRMAVKRRSGVSADTPPPVTR
ncbi:MAG TPA: glycosyltransferase, partial [Geobacteraceae bacterium]|nr:glycosyltransferase [Geobacteraceae bacterium]